MDGFLKTNQEIEGDLTEQMEQTIATEIEGARQHHAAAQRLGTVGARSSAFIGTVVGAVGAVGLAVGRFFAVGATAGARSAWQGSRPPPGLGTSVVGLSCP